MSWTIFSDAYVDMRFILDSEVSFSVRRSRISGKIEVQRVSIFLLKLKFQKLHEAV